MKSDLDGDAMDYYWATTDAKRIPRKMIEVGSRFKDFIMNTYSEEYMPDSIFALPSYCSSALCPDSTICGKLRGSQLQQE